MNPLDTDPNDVINQINQLFQAQASTALQLRQSTAKQRIEKIKRIKSVILAHKAEIIQAGFDDFSKPATEVELTEILPIIAEANEAIRHLKGWMKKQRVWPSRMMLGTRGYIQFEPKGRSLIISPWNYPFNLTFGPLISAIAAGNTAMIKPSEMTPCAAALMAKIIEQFFHEDEVALFQGQADISQALLALPFDHIFFTGSPNIGKVVMAAAAKHLSSVTLELGGKSPTIIDESADLTLAAQTTLWAKFTNNGQTCIAPDHIYVHQNVKAAFLEECKKILVRTYGTEENQIKSPDLARICNARHLDRLEFLLDDAIQRGATVVTGGQIKPELRYIAPTLLDNLPDDAAIMQEEIFGPLLPIISFNSINEVIQRINAAPKPLALYIWGRNSTNIDKVMQQTSSGGACINHSVVQFLHGNLPFGGVNNSGLGNSHGYYGFLAFSHSRAVVRNSIMLAKMFFPPYRGFTRKLINFFMKMV